MMELLGNFDYLLVYIDDILPLQRHGELEEDHLKKMEIVLKPLNVIGFRANQEVEYLGFLLTSDAVKP